MEDILWEHGSRDSEALRDTWNGTIEVELMADMCCYSAPHPPPAPPPMPLLPPDSTWPEPQLQQLLSGQWRGTITSMAMNCMP
jgi:hypothetical protein